jgi:hypothetical protein
VRADVALLAFMARARAARSAAPGTRDREHPDTAERATSKCLHARAQLAATVNDGVPGSLVGVGIGTDQEEARPVKKGKSQLKKPAADKPKTAKVKPPRQAKLAHRPKDQ